MFGRKFRKTGAAQPPVPVVEDSPQNALASADRPLLIKKGVQEPVTPYVARSALPAPATPESGTTRTLPRFRPPGFGFKKGGEVAGSSKGSSASKRGDGIATKGKTKGRII